MKTLYKTALSDQVVKVKVAQLEQKTGVKWDGYYTGGRTRFTAVARYGYAELDEAAALKLLPFLDDKRRSFETIWKASGLDWKTIVDGAWTLCRTGRAKFDTNRFGHMAGVGLK